MCVTYTIPVGAGCLKKNSDGSLSAVTPDGACDTPARYPDGTMVWGIPKRIPAYLKQALTAELNEAIKNGVGYSNDRLQ
jgi:hypothetical protein